MRGQIEDAVSHVLGHGEVGEEGVALDDIAKATVVGRDVEAGRSVEDRAVVNGDAAAVRGEETGNGLEGEGFAGAGLAEEDGDSRADLERGGKPEVAERESDVDPLITGRGFRHGRGPRKAIRTARGNGGQDDGDGDGGVGVGFHGFEDGEGHGLGSAGDVAGEHDGGAELAEGAGPSHDGAAGQRGERQRHGDAAEGAPGAGAEGGGNGFEALVDALESGAGGADVEGGGDEHLGEDDGGGGEGDIDAGAGEGPPTGPWRPRSRSRQGRRRRGAGRWGGR